jgi:DNA-binding transcriptional ArsR family regulator
MSDTRHPLMDDEEITIDDLEMFRIVDNPLRQRIMHLARHPRSVREIAQRLGVPATRLYYHVNMLEEAGFLEVVEVRKSGAQLERVYRGGRRGALVPSQDLVEQIGDPRKAAHVLAGALFDITRAEVEAQLARSLDYEEEPVGTLARVVLQLPEDLATGFAERIEALAMEMRDAARDHEDADGGLYSFTYAFVSMDAS